MTRSTLCSLSVVFRIAVQLLFILYCSSWLPVARASKLDDLKNLRSRCFSDAVPCILLSDHVGSYGCAQCDAQVQEAPIIEFVTRSELTQWIGKYPTRAVMIPEFLFFDTAVLAALESANNVATLVVYSGESPLLEGNLLPGETYPYPPLQRYSDDLKEPNARSNFYFSSPTSTSDSSEGVTADLIEFAASRSMSRNIPGHGSNFYFFPFNIFHISGESANFIRNESERFREETIVVGTDSSLLRPRPRTAPRYKLKSTGEMYACRSTPAPADNETQDEAESSTSVDVNPITLVTSQRCLEAKTCLPVGGHSVWSSMGGVTNETNEVLAITAPIDSMAFFPDLAFGASAEVSSLAVLMAVSEAVSTYYREAKGPALGPPTILPIFFAWNSEAWGYAGSSRFLQDLNDLRNCNSGQDSPACAQLNELSDRSPKLRYLQNADFTFLNIGQLISPEWWNNFTSSGTAVNITYRLYHSNFDCANEKIDNPDAECSVVSASENSDFSTTLKSAFETVENRGGSNVRVSLKEVREMQEFPLDATHSIYRHRPGSSVFSFASYSALFDNKYYHSIYDNKSLTNYTPLANDTEHSSGRVPLYIAAQGITDAVISYIFGDTTTTQLVNNSQIDDIIHCLTTNNWASCKLGEEYNTSTTPIISNGDVKGGNHVGSFFDWERSKTASVSMAVKVDFIRNFFAYHNRYDNVESLDQLNKCVVSSDCDTYRKNVNMEGSYHTVHCIRKKCVVSDTYLHDAFGTGINSTDKDRTEFVFSETADSGLTEPQKSAWTESVWDEELSLCAFVEDTALYGGLILTAGITVFILSLLLTIAFDRYMTKTMQPYEEELLALTRPVEALP